MTANHFKGLNKAQQSIIFKIIEKNSKFHGYFDNIAGNKKLKKKHFFQLYNLDTVGSAVFTTIGYKQAMVSTVISQNKHEIILRDNL